MPRRRPPITAREIGAYLCGRRLYLLWLPLERKPEVAELWFLNNAGEEDVAILLSMKRDVYWRFFHMGWHDCMDGKSY